MGTPRSRRILSPVVALLTALVLALVGVGAAQAHPDHHRYRHHHGQTWKVWVGSQSPNLAIQGLRFLPGSITIDQGDRVTWVANSAEPHTVTFLDGGKAQATLPEFDPADPTQITQQGGHSVHGNGYFSSGIMTTVPTGGDSGPFPPVTHYQRYTLKFPHVGTYTYYCLIHGAMMVGTIKVQDRGAPYPSSPWQYQRQARAQARALLVEGIHLWRDAWKSADDNHVITGADDGAVAVMRFVPPVVHVKVGESVTFENTGMGAPHTVTFGTEPPPPGLFAPSGDPTSYAGGDLNSGIILPGGTFTVTFTKAGTYDYVCALHDFMGMKGKVVVSH